MKKNLPVTGRENDYSDRITIISTTDIKGIITYVNQGFVEVSGFSEAELLGKNHNIVRHPDMPPVAFRDLWDTLKAGKPWRGIVKNRCKNGDHYWVDAYATPVYQDGQLAGYQSVRSKPKRAQIEAADKLYRALWQRNVEKLSKPWRLIDIPVNAKALAAFVALALLAVLAGAAGLSGMRAKEEAMHAQVEQLEQRMQTLAAVAAALPAGEQQTRVFTVLNELKHDLGKTHAAAEPALYRVVVASMLAALALALGLTLLNRRLFTVPLLRAMESTKAIAAGDLTQRVEVDANDELGQVLQAVKMMQARLQTVIGRIAEFTAALAADASEVSTVAQQSNEGMQRQRNETDMVATAMTEMAAAVQEVARHATEAARVAQQTSGDVTAGKRAVQEVIGAIDTLARSVEQAGAVIAQLEQKSQDIGTILDVIRGIADQTNLLALNAAIEAARAGEQGRGFAVVADEVRTLAQRTQDSTAEIQAMIEGLQSEARGAAKVMALSRDHTGGTVQLASQAGAVLDNITRQIQRINDINAQIATASEEQSAVSEEINRNVVAIAQVAEQTSVGADKTSQCCAHLAEQTHALQQLVTQFKLG